MSVISDLVNIEEFDKKENFNPERGDVSFYCKECKKIVETNRPNPKGYSFICKICSSDNISIWTLEWLKSNYKIKD